MWRAGGTSALTEQFVCGRSCKGGGSAGTYTAFAVFVYFWHQKFLVLNATVVFRCVI